MLAAYHRLEPRHTANGELYVKPGMRAYPDLPEGVALLQANADVEAEGVVDASGSAGALALAQSQGVVLETSQATLRCAKRTFAAQPQVELMAGALWDVAAGSTRSIFLLPSTDKGNLRIEAELRGAFNALEEAGVVHLAMHKDQGAKRYEKWAAALFGDLRVVAKRGGWRLSQAVKRKGAAEAVTPQSFEAAGLKLQAEPGVYAAGKLDPGTALLLESIDLAALAGKRVLDLGCGYGLLALKAALHGAAVSALDDDLLAVRATYRNARTYGLDIRCLHSDVNSALKPGETFEMVLMNPPFHVGKGVRLEVPGAFIAAAYQHLEPGGELILVANKALPYEEWLARFAYWETLTTNATFKVLRAIR